MPGPSRRPRPSGDWRAGAKPARFASDSLSAPPRSDMIERGALEFVNPTNNDGTRNAVLLAGSRVTDPHESEAGVVVSCRGRAKSIGRDCKVRGRRPARVAAVRNGCGCGSRRCLCWWEWLGRLIWFMTSTASLSGPDGPPVVRRPDYARVGAFAPLALRAAEFGRSPLLQGMAGAALDQPGEVIEPIEQAKRLGYDPESIACLIAIYQARAATPKMPSRSWYGPFAIIANPARGCQGDGKDLSDELSAEPGRRGDQTCPAACARGSPALLVEQRNRLTRHACRARDPDPELLRRSGAEPEPGQVRLGLAETQPGSPLR